MNPAGRHVFPYCPHCRVPMDRKPDGGRNRPFCPGCGFIQYLNPAPGAGVVLLRGTRVCLVKRKFAPHEGLWSLPTGFMEWDEDVAETARREMEEETGLQVVLTGVHAVESGVLPPDLPVVVVFYGGREVGGALQAGDDAAEVDFFELDDLPHPIAFAAHRRVLSRLADEVRRTVGDDEGPAETQGSR